MKKSDREEELLQSEQIISTKGVKKAFLILEAIILLFGAFLSLSGTSKAVEYSDSYQIYYWIAALGVLFVGILDLLRKKKLVVFLGFLLILIYLVVAGSIFMDCLLYADNMSFFKSYEGKTISIYIGDETYDWNGEAFFYGISNFEVVNLDGEENYCEMNGKKQKINSVRKILGEPDKVYCSMHSGKDYKWLVFVRRKD